jgi:glycosyltransferase involved in cell wall biosynthesis
MNSLVSIIMPVYNAERFISDAINSVLEQTYPNWELLIINDGSVDGSEQIIKTFNDNRIRVFDQSNQGVSAARNVGLKNMKGDYFCFLDADDVMSPNSLRSRLDIFNSHPDISFVDGKVEKWDEAMQIKLETWSPSMIGNPLEDLVTLSGKSFFGPTWMIKRKREFKYHMLDGLTHGEDLLFYIELASNGEDYLYTNDVILKYRYHSQSAMRNLDQLGQGYYTIYQFLLNKLQIPSTMLVIFRKRVRRIMFFSYIRKMDFIKAFKSLK